MYRIQVHRLAGHVARLPSESPANAVMHTRALAWWRHVQQNWAGRDHRVFGAPHPRRFRAWRWEGQLEACYGKAAFNLGMDRLSDVGWMGLAQDRESWKRNEGYFASLPAMSGAT